MMFHFIINPKAGKGKSLKALEYAKQKFFEKGVPYEVHFTTHPRHATEIAQELTTRGEQDIIAIGGDGTLNEVLNGLARPNEVRLGLIPAGTGNDFATNANLPKKHKDAVDQLLTMTAKPTDYMQMEGVRGINVIGTGLDVDVLKNCKKAKIFRGKIQYVLSLIKTVITFRFFDFTRQMNGETDRRSAMIACVGNGRNFGGGIPICPDAVIDDGQMDCVVVGKIKKITIPSAFLALMRGKILKKKYVTCSRTEVVEITPDIPRTVQVDGELYDDLPFRVQLIKGGLNFYRP